MSAGIKAAAKKTLWRLGYYTRRLRRDEFPGPAVLCYHGVRADDEPAGAQPFSGLHVPAAELEAHCSLIRRDCNPISLTQWLAASAEGASLPPRPVLMTFDDGYRNVLTLGAPILAEYEIPAVVFVCSGPVVRMESFWFVALARRQGEAVVERAKGLGFHDWKEACRESRQIAEPTDPAAPLSPDEVRRLAETPGVEIGGHTLDHPILAKADVDEQRRQIAEDKAKLESWTGRPVRSFAYPNGRPALDYTSETVQVVAKAGFETAFTTRHGFAAPTESAYERSRFFMTAGISAPELAHRLCYSWRK
jgi:peptidoglycan/xylan/chitin deacetylase (PgdA/CDA1 family)